MGQQDCLKGDWLAKEPLSPPLGDAEDVQKHVAAVFRQNITGRKALEALIGVVRRRKGPGRSGCPGGRGAAVAGLEGQHEGGPVLGASGPGAAGPAHAEGHTYHVGSFHQQRAAPRIAALAGAVAVAVHGPQNKMKGRVLRPLPVAGADRTRQRTRP